MSKISVSAEGVIRFIYDDALLGLLSEGKPSVTRASHVEPCALGWGGWIADLSPVSGPVLGPYTTRHEALAAEVEWINTNIL